MQKDNPGLFLKEIPFLIEKTKYGNIKCQSRSRQRQLIQSLLPNYTNSIFCEIGLFGGINLFANYDLCKKYNIEVVGIDPHDKIEIFNGVNKNSINNNLVDKRLELWKELRLNIENIINTHNLNIKYINDTSWNAYKQIEDNSIGILHIDGDHSYEGVKKDLNLFYGKMKKNSVILMDDFKWNGIKKATLEFIKENKNSLKLEETFEGNKGIIYISK